MKKKSQGEIFGIALLFVVIIIGVIIYGQFQAVKPDRNLDVKKEAEYLILAQSTLNSIKKISTGCQIDSSTDSLEALVSYCMDNSRTQTTNPKIQCGSEEKDSCSYSIEIINKTLFNLFGNNSPIIGNIPFSVTISTPFYQHRILNGTYENLDQIKFRGEILTLENYLQNGFRRVSSGREIIPTQKRAVELILNLYYI